MAGAKAKGRGKKAESLLVQQRIEEILVIRLDGAEFYDVRQYASEKGWRLSERQLRRYVNAADDLIVASVEGDRKKLISRHHLQRRRLYAQAIEVGDLRTALAAAKDEADLAGLYPPKETKLDLTGPAFKVYAGFDPETALCPPEQQPPSPKPAK